jgi:hypothetical protein
MFRSWLLFPKSSGRGNTRFVFGSGRVYSDYPSDSSFLKSTLFSGLSSAFSKKNFEPFFPVKGSEYRTPISE